MSFGNHKKPQQLLEQQSAVLAYLEDLLKEIPESADESPAPQTDNVVEAFPGRSVTEPPAQPAPVIEEQPASLPPAPAPAPAPAPQESAPEAVAESSDSNTDEVIPAWAQEEFQCLLFNVTGITLAVPLVKLNGVIPWSNELTPMPGHSDAFLGLLRHLERNVQVMDTACVILPDVQRSQLAAPADRIDKILLMGEGRWGLACDGIGEVITLQHQDVRWRTTSGKRQWLAGTVSERLCALLDVDNLALMLREGQED